MTLDLLTGTWQGLTYAAVIKDRQLFDLALDAAGTPPLYQSVWRVAVDRMIPKIGTFVKLGSAGTGLLKDFQGRSGETLIVQVKSVRCEDKAHIVTRDIALAGPRFVYLPLSPGVKTPRQTGKSVNQEAVITALAEAGVEGGIIRTGAAKSGIEAIVVEASELRQRWLAMTASRETGLLLPGPDARQRLLLDYAEQPVTLSAAECDTGLLATLAGSKVDLGQGASLIIERTSALIAIDVNGGPRSQADANMAAAHEIARQIRVRNLSGLIVIDFAAPGPKPGNALFKAMERALMPDPARPRIMGVTPAGLLEITRPRRTPPLEEMLKKVHTTTP